VAFPVHPPWEACTTMPRRKGGRAVMRDWFTAKVSGSFALSTLGSGTALAATLLDIDDDCFIYSTNMLIAIRGLTPGEGPIEVGLASDSMSVANIIEALDASPTARDDRIALERTGRPVRRLGVFDGQSATEKLNNGLEIYRKLLFPLTQSRILDQYAVNRSGATLTTGSTVDFFGRIHGYWT